MYFIGVIIVIIIGVWLYWSTQPDNSLWNDMVSARFSVAELNKAVPEYVTRWEDAVIHAETVFRTLLSKPIQHTDYPYQQIKDVWQEVLTRWDEMAAAPGTTFLQEEVAFGSRYIREYANRKLEQLKQYDDTKWRTVWIGAGQPRDPHENKYASLLV